MTQQKRQHGSRATTPGTTTGVSRFFSPLSTNYFASVLQEAGASKRGRKLDPLLEAVLARHKEEQAEQEETEEERCGARRFVFVLR